MTSVSQSGTTVTIQGTGFSNQLESNIVSIGESGSCTVQSASATTIVCNIINAPAGQHVLQVNIADKGLASSSTVHLVNVPLVISSFSPNGGDSGGGYQLTVIGSGFSSNTLIQLGNNYCINITLLDFTTIQCIIPPSSSASLIQVPVKGNDGTNTAVASTQFTYNVTLSITPIIYSINPTFVTMNGGLLRINGTGFGTNDIAVLIGIKNTRILSSSNNYIVANLTALSPGLYPVTVRTQSGFARPLFQIEYRFYVQQISPQVGSAYGGTDIYLNGVGFDNRTRVQLRGDKTDRICPCNIVSRQTNQIHCQTTKPTREVRITSYGTHPVYGFGYSWLPIRETVEQGTVVTWSWDSTQLLTPAYYKIEQMSDSYSTTPLPDGFDSGTPTTSGKTNL